MILNIFKSKPKLKEIIPKGFIDIHSHVLPGIDDGAKNINESFEMISEMKKLGFSKIIGTPHTYEGLYNNTNESIKKSYDLLYGKFDGDIKIKYASEYLADYNLIKKAEKRNILCLKENYVLIETSFNHKPLNLLDIIFKLQTNGYTPIIAHPERYSYMYENKYYFSLAHRGCKFQVNLLSAVGYYGKKCTKITDFLLKNNLIDFAGSDLHNTRQISLFNNRLKIKNKIKLINVLENNMNYFG